MNNIKQVGLRYIYDSCSRVSKNKYNLLCITFSFEFDIKRHFKDLILYILCAYKGIDPL